MLDSPYVRRCAVTLDILGLNFEHRPLSVFSAPERFAAINPLLKAPTLVTDEGTVLVDSTLIIDWAECVARHSLLPSEPVARARVLRTVGLSMVACDKAVQIVYERLLRPQEKRHQPWIDRVTAQARAACELLEADISNQARGFDVSRLDAGAIAAAIACTFTRAKIPDLLAETPSAALEAFTEMVEGTHSFKRWPYTE